MASSRTDRGRDAVEIRVGIGRIVSTRRPVQAPVKAFVPATGSAGLRHPRIRSDAGKSIGLEKRFADGIEPTHMTWLDGDIAVIASTQRVEKRLDVARDPCKTGRQFNEQAAQSRTESFGRGKKLVKQRLDADQLSNATISLGSLTENRKSSGTLAAHFA